MCTRDRKKRDIDSRNETRETDKQRTETKQTHIHKESDAVAELHQDEEYAITSGEHSGEEYETMLYLNLTAVSLERDGTMAREKAW